MNCDYEWCRHRNVGGVFGFLEGLVNVIRKQIGEVEA
jgi:hypothetical protein